MLEPTFFQACCATSPAGKPIDAAQLEAAEKPSDVAPADLARLSLEEMAASESLPLFVR